MRHSCLLLGVRHTFLADHRQHIVSSHDLAALVRDLRVPADLSISGSDAQRLLLARQSHLDAVPGLHRFGEPQRIDTVVGKYGPVGRIDKETSRGRNQKVSMRNAAAEQRIALRRLFIHVRVEMIARQRGEALDVLEGDRSLLRVEGIADPQGTEWLPEGMYVGIESARALDPATGHSRNDGRSPLYRGALHVVQYTPDTAKLLPSACASGAAMHEVRQGRAV